MKRFVRCVCFLMIISMLAAIPAFAAESAEPRASYYFACSTVCLIKQSTYTFEAWFDVNGLGIMDEIGASSIKIQRSLDGVNWTTMKTFTKANYPDLVDYNTSTHTACVRYTGTRGYYYRSVVNLWAKNSSGSAIMTEYSTPILIGG